MRRSLAFLLIATLVLTAGCAVRPLPAPEQALRQPALPASVNVAAGLAARNFVAVVARMEPLIESECRVRRPSVNCDFLIGVDDRPGEPPNAFQTLDRSGRPVVVFTLALIATARNQDELAFVLGHESAHHLAGHIARAEESALQGALIAGALTALSGGSPASIASAQQLGATAGARRYSKDFELEADALGTIIAFNAGYDPLRGAAFFARIPDPGDRFLGTHPPNAQRLQVVRDTVVLMSAS